MILNKVKWQADHLARQSIQNNLLLQRLSFGKSLSSQTSLLIQVGFALFSICLKFEPSARTVSHSNSLLFIGESEPSHL